MHKLRFALAATLLTGALLLSTSGPASAAPVVKPTHIQVTGGFLLNKSGPLVLPIGVQLGGSAWLYDAQGHGVDAPITFVSNGKPICTTVQYPMITGLSSCAAIAGMGPGFIYALLGFPVEARFAGKTIGDTTYLPSTAPVPYLGL